MSKIVIKELFAADNIDEVIDKINFNFDQLVINGGGPKGNQGDQGDFGPVGPRGAVYFTPLDIYTTETSPSWSGTAERVNDENDTDFPVYKGDPNNYLPVGNGSSPANTFEIGWEEKKLRGGDLWVQEGDDGSNLDGDLWEYNADDVIWEFTGVNLRGSQGVQGDNADDLWARLEDSNEDIIYQLLNTGQPTHTIIGSDNPSEALITGSESSVLTILKDSNFTHNIGLRFKDGSDDHKSYIGINSSGAMTITGSSTGSGNGIYVTAQNDIQLNNSVLQYLMDYSDTKHRFSGGRFEFIVPIGNTESQIQRTDGKGFEFSLTDTQSRLKSDANTNMILQNNGQHVGIGQFSGSSVGSKLTVDGEVSIGSGYKATTAPSNGIIVQGKAGIGRDTVLSSIILSVYGNVNIREESAYAWNGYAGPPGWFTEEAGYHARIEQANNGDIRLVVNTSSIAANTLNGDEVWGWYYDASKRSLGINTNPWSSGDMTLHIDSDEDVTLMKMTNSATSSGAGFNIFIDGNKDVWFDSEEEADMYWRLDETDIAQLDYSRWSYKLIGGTRNNIELRPYRTSYSSNIDDGHVLRYSGGDGSPSSENFHFMLWGGQGSADTETIVMSLQGGMGGTSEGVVNIGGIGNNVDGVLDSSGLQIKNGTVMRNYVAGLVGNTKTGLLAGNSTLYTGTGYTIAATTYSGATATLQIEFDEEFQDTPIVVAQVTEIATSGGNEYEWRAYATVVTTTGFNLVITRGNDGNWTSGLVQASFIATSA